MHTDESDWHLDKRWHLMQVAALLLSLAGAIVYVVRRDGEYDKRMSAMETSMEQQRMRDARQDEQQRARDDIQDRTAAEAVALVRQQLDRMESKLDRFVESRARQR